MDISPTTSWPKPYRPKLSAQRCYTVHPMLNPNAVYRFLARVLERRPALYRGFTAVEKVSKERLFGCQMCGQCELPTTGYTCPMTCPKQLRNGPCGGVFPDGRCEVQPQMRCVWVMAYERAEIAGRTDDLALLQRPVDHRERGRSSWINYWQGRDAELAAPAVERPPLVPVRPAAAS